MRIPCPSPETACRTLVKYLWLYQNFAAGPLERAGFTTRPVPVPATTPTVQQPTFTRAPAPQGAQQSVPKPAPDNAEAPAAAAEEQVSPSPGLRRAPGINDAPASVRRRPTLA